MENNYYTPELEEFHIGFEYEWLNENNDWIKESSPTEITEDGFDEQTYGLRVKYLDREDIESLGWIITWEDCKKYGDYYKGYLNKTNIWYAKLTNQIPYVVLTGGESNGNTRVKIKNKSELVKLIKQLGINEGSNT
jgi:hypothetical protein